MNGNYNQYLRILKIAGIPPDKGQQICNSLDEKTIKRFTKVGFQRSIIAPILEEALRMNGGINDNNVNMLLDNQNFIIKLMRECSC